MREHRLLYIKLMFKLFLKILDNALLSLKKLFFLSLVAIVISSVFSYMPAVKLYDSVGKGIDEMTVVCNYKYRSAV